MSVLELHPDLIKMNKNVLEIKREKLDDCDLLLSNFLHKLHVYKVTGDSEKGVEFFERYCHVSEDWMEFTVKKVPQRLVVQSNIIESNLV